MVAVEYKYANKKLYQLQDIEGFHRVILYILRPVYTGDSMQLNAIFVAPKLQLAAISLRF